MRSPLHTVRLSDDGKLLILDQTALPGKIEYLALSKAEEIYEAIQTLRVRGAPAIGVAAAIGLYAVSRSLQTEDTDAFLAELSQTAAYLASSRPTAVNLSWALGEMLSCARENRHKPAALIREALRERALALRTEDIAVCRAIGLHGAALLRDGMGILTHCNAGMLAAVEYGTALAPVYTASEQGVRDLRVYCDETRPLLQGARLTALELTMNGIDTTLICDNTASWVMAQGLVQAVFVGCDRVALNGDTANKIGTSGAAILARHYGIPFYVCCPLSTLDESAETGADIPIEHRPGTEVTDMTIKVLNPAFDITPAELITGFVTETGICRRPARRDKRLFA